jgi:predicted nucleotidyltransferase
MEASKPSYPSKLHREIAEKLAKYYSGWRSVYAVVVVGSLANGFAAKDSDIDLCVLTDNFDAKKYARSNQIRFDAYSRMGARVEWRYRGIEEFLYFGDIRVDLEFSNGDYAAYTDPFDVVRDGYELSVGNVFAYGAPVYLRPDGKYWAKRRRVLPYYDERLRNTRIRALKREFEYKSGRVTRNVERGNFLMALEDLVVAWREFAQLVFMVKKVYPVSYDKWLAQQDEKLLGSKRLNETHSQVFGDYKLNTEQGLKHSAQELRQQFNEALKQEGNDADTASSTAPTT